MTNACIKGWGQPAGWSSSSHKEDFHDIKGHKTTSSKRGFVRRKAVCDTNFRTIGFDFLAVALQLGGLTPLQGRALFMPENAKHITVWFYTVEMYQTVTEVTSVSVWSAMPMTVYTTSMTFQRWLSFWNQPFFSFFNPIWKVNLSQCCFFGLSNISVSSICYTQYLLDLA